MFWRSEFTGVVPFDQADKAWRRLGAFDWERAVTRLEGLLARSAAG